MPNVFKSNPNTYSLTPLMPIQPIALMLIVFIATTQLLAAMLGTSQTQ